MPVAFDSAGGSADIASGHTAVLTGIPDHAFVVWTIGIEADTTISLPSGWTSMSLNTLGTGTGRTIKRLFNGPASNGVTNFGSSTEFISIWCAYTGVLSSEHLAGQFADAPSLTASRKMTSKDMWIAFGIARRTGHVTPTSYTLRSGNQVFDLANVTAERVGQDSDTENPVGMFTGPDNGFESIGTLALLAKPVGGGWGMTMGPRGLIATRPQFIDPGGSRERIWFPTLDVPTSHPLTLRKAA